MFALNLKPLLMQPPVKGHVTMGLDPGYAHGCKVAVIDATGKVLDTTVVYPTYGERQKNEAVTKLAQLVKKHGVEHIAIGNGTASRETEQMTVELIHKVGGGLSYMIVSEAGASVYSASKLAAEEFPQFDVNLRSAVSIARRLQDPLAELVKIDPKAIGVGQYQHDMPQKELDASLNAVVEDCVNAVGVDLNTASPSLLTRVAGLNGTIAKNIVAAGLASKCQLELAYAIGVAEPVSVLVDTFGTGKLSDWHLGELVRKCFDLRPASIIQTLDLRRPIYQQVAAYGHFGRPELDLPWEKLDRVEQLQKNA